MSTPLPDFQRIQRAFAAHIRDPARHPPPPGVPAERMKLYRDLFYNNIESVLAAAFPVLKATLGGARWHVLVQDFFAQHRSTTPYFAEIAEELLDYLQDERSGEPGEPAFLIELAHYEWVELALSVSEAQAPDVPAQMLEDGADGRLYLSELAWPLAYRYPVHQIGPNAQPDSAPPAPTFLIAYRNREDAVKFLEVSVGVYRLLTLLKERGPCDAWSLIQRIARDLHHPDPAALLTASRGTLQDLADRSILGIGHVAGGRTPSGA